eukprot:CAMPEP_0179005676 /NCGR_PEP_ID=MMETSP0795-20121207/14087_1 /TAXON_ID=88552 /ORGANISM="Amoebophrya sp., Strain Ameob2" /LENGTH=341 /DNA_ID=CAMNT_0020700265 /DNA_START=252 /DNA_END=1278 /DNA_ORIENTATION=-
MVNMLGKSCKKLLSWVCACAALGWGTCNGGLSSSMGVAAAGLLPPVRWRQLPGPAAGVSNIESLRSRLSGVNALNLEPCCEGSVSLNRSSPWSGAGTGSIQQTTADGFESLATGSRVGDKTMDVDPKNPGEKIVAINVTGEGGVNYTPKQNGGNRGPKGGKEGKRGGKKGGKGKRKGGDGGGGSEEASPSCGGGSSSDSLLRRQGDHRVGENTTRYLVAQEVCFGKDGDGYKKVSEKIEKLEGGRGGDPPEVEGLRDDDRTTAFEASTQQKSGRSFARTRVPVLAEKKSVARARLESTTSTLSLVLKMMLQLLSLILIRNRFMNLHHATTSHIPHPTSPSA